MARIAPIELSTMFRERSKNHAVVITWKVFPSTLGAPTVKIERATIDSANPLMAAPMTRRVRDWAAAQ